MLGTTVQFVQEFSDFCAAKMSKESGRANAPRLCMAKPAAWELRRGRFATKV
jgi:hypothetical protein